MKNILFFGGGNIAQSVIEGLIKSGYKRNNIFFIDRNTKNKKKLEKLKIKEFSKDKTDQISFFFLCVKPKDALSSFKEIKQLKKNAKVISFVAGIKSNKYIKIDETTKFMRAMPNTSSRYGLGITALFNSTFGIEDKKLINKLFNKVGMVIELNKEIEMDQFTGLVGSGPAYFFYILKAYEKELLKMCSDDNRKVNEIMVNLLKGVSMSIKNNNDLDALVTMVASKKGTTEAGLDSFKKNKLNKYFKDGLQSAVKRSKEISNEF